MTKNTAADWAREIVGQMNDDDREAIRRDGAEGWREGVNLLTWEDDDGPRPDTDAVLSAIEQCASEMATAPVGTAMTPITPEEIRALRAACEAAKHPEDPITLSASAMLRLLNASPVLRVEAREP